MTESWIVVVDDDVISLKNARNMLMEQNMKVSCVKSGRELLSFMEKNTPDLILLDVLMPEQDGFETYEKLRELERREERNQTPVIFLTGDEDSETEKKGLEIGASDFIRKPFNRESLLWRIHNVISKNKKIETLTEEATVDKLTGFLNKAAATEKMTDICSKETGIMSIIDLDNFKLVNDIYGHDMGDKVLSSFADIARSNTRADDVLCRIGGDEFLAFFRNLSDENVTISLTKRLNDQLTDKCKNLMGSDFNIDIGVSVGCVIVTEQDKVYDSLFRAADKALYYVKKNGKHSCSMSNSESYDGADDEEDLNNELFRITHIVEERGGTDGALWLNRDSFIWCYRLIIRFMKRHQEPVIKLLFSVSAIISNELISEKGMAYDKDVYSEAIQSFGITIQNNIRKSDIMMQDKNHYYVLLPELNDDNVHTVTDRVIAAWENNEYHDKVKIEYVKECLDYSKDE